jgi:hypothetical protein
MCCFSRPVKKVAGTNIFARESSRERQYLVYSMTLSAPEDLAMILPLPVPKATKEDAVRFINLEKYADFFADMYSGFPHPDTKPADDDVGREPTAAKRKLAVIDVGSFQASFVPSIKDFERLDERFRLPGEIWDKLGQYRDYGFAVFKLKQDKKDAQKIHPMAFEFPRANPKKLFFPTVHIHDGKVHAKASFDHRLYCQTTGNEELSMFDWTESTGHAEQFIKIDKAQGIVAKEEHCYLYELHGNHNNVDIVV